MSILMYRSIHGMAPAYLCNEITLHSKIAERTTISVNDNNVFVPYAHLESFKNSFTHRGHIGLYIYIYIYIYILSYF